MISRTRWEGVVLIVLDWMLEDSKQWQGRGGPILWKICVASFMHGPLPILAALHGASPDVSTSSLIVRSVGFAAQDRRATNKRIRNKVAVGIGITLSLSMAFEMNWMLYGLIYTNGQMGGSMLCLLKYLLVRWCQTGHCYVVQKTSGIKPPRDHFQMLGQDHFIG